MAEANETIADIIAEMRAREGLDGGDMVDNFDIYSGEYGGWDALMLIKAYADRLDAAHKREHEALEFIAHYNDDEEQMDDPYCADGHKLADKAKEALGIKEKEGGAK